MSLHTLNSRLLAACVIIAAAQLSRGDSINMTTETGEMMMNAQFQDELLLQSALPWTLSDALHYVDAYNTSTGAFTYSTLPGQTLAGLSFNLSTVGSFDATTGSWTWSGVGSYGSTGFELTGSGTLNIDPSPIDVTGAETVRPEDDGKKEIKGKYHDDDGNAYDATGTVTIDQTETGGKSSGTGEAKDANGRVVKSGKITDQQSLRNGRDRPWEIQFVADNGLGNGAWAGGVDIAVGGAQFQGTFTQQLVPEPSSFTLVGGLGLALLFFGSWRRRSRIIDPVLPNSPR